MNKKVQVDFTGNAQALYSVTKGIKKEIGGLKSAFAGAIGIGAIGMMVNGAIEFAKEASKSADEMGVTVDRAVQLNRIMSTVGKGSGDLVSAMSSVQEYMKAAYTDGYKLTRLKMLGIDRKDMENFDFDKILRKSLEATKNMKQAEAQMRLREIYGGAGNDLYRKREEILKSPEEAGITKAQVQDIIELTNKFKELKQTIDILILQALRPFIELLLKANAETRDVEETHQRRVQKAHEIAQKKGEAMPGGVKTLATEIGAGVANFVGSVITVGHLSKDAKLRSSSTVIRDMFSKETAEEALKAVAPVTSYEDALKAFRKSQNKNDNGNNIAPSAFKREMSSNNMLQIGGLMGIDINYRLAQFAERSASATERTAAATEAINSKFHPTPNNTQVEQPFISFGDPQKKNMVNTKFGPRTY